VPAVVRIAALIAAAGIALAACGASSERPASVGAGGGEFTAGGRTTSLPDSDCSEYRGTQIGVAWSRDAQLSIRRSATRGSVLARVRRPGERTEFWVVSRPEVAFDAPTLTASGTGRSVTTDPSFRGRITCPADRGAGSGEILVGDAAVAVDEVFCDGTADEELDIAASGTLDGRPVRLTVSRNATENGVEDAMHLIGPSRGSIRTTLAGGGDLRAFRGLFTMTGDQVETRERLVLKGPAGESTPIAVAVTCGLNIIR
jgi:hypothetical protein